MTAITSASISIQTLSSNVPVGQPLSYEIFLNQTIFGDTKNSFYEVLVSILIIFENILLTAMTFVIVTLVKIKCSVD